MPPAPLKGLALQTAVRDLPGWKVIDDHHLAREFKFPDFKTALAFVNRIGDRAEALNHHPNLTLTWGRVGVETWSHDANGITQRDIQLAREIDQHYEPRP